MVLFSVFLTDSKNDLGRGRALLTQLVVGVTLKMPTGCGNGVRLFSASVRPTKPSITVRLRPVLAVTRALL